ncbi:molybdenum ABC transporter ATP-binding protein [Janthinobacterium sp. 17J80-10]|uniref:molybdenum ABC transporter ATP-binding protein n=1 Tax=Janthinobacterium sp. 17J80-10 TaxID=2497863 RepID=UPI0010056017|nr:molybdenum ABC transporter ATP-binding protein [Janthinobacterium sp. 17J80-10]QAU34338.1 molybdenum ABC transporter ATP-binding protein [Janthinobacterium sp. 17J80-10]
MSTHGIHAGFTIRRDGFFLQAELALPSRGVTAIVGPSGCGKTTLLRAIAGLERHAGYLSVNGETWQDDENGIFVPIHLRGVGFVFQEASLLPHLTVRRNLEFGWKRTAPPLRKLEQEQMLSLLGIAHLLDRHPAGLSGGERQRVAIARTLLTSPSLLLMDEPMASLDMMRRHEVLPYLERIHDELAIPVIYVSHAPDEVARLADHIVVLDCGRVAASGPIAEITARLDLPMAFEDDAGVVVTGVVESYDEQYQLACVRIADGLIRVAHRRLPLGASLRVRILARDVVLNLGPHQDTSALNQLPADVVAEMPAKTQMHAIIRLDAAGIPLLARITRLSRDCLHIAAGKKVWVQFKATALLTPS